MTDDPCTALNDLVTMLICDDVQESIGHGIPSSFFRPIFNSQRPVTTQRCALRSRQLLDALLGQLHERREFGFRECRFLTGPLDLDELSAAGHHDIHINFRGNVLNVGQIEQTFAVDDTHADGRHAAR